MILRSFRRRFVVSWQFKCVEWIVNRDRRRRGRHADRRGAPRQKELGLCRLWIGLNAVSPIGPHFAHLCRLMQMHEKKARLILSVNRVRISLDGTDEVHDVEKDV
jgi:hypothetical protein